MSGGFHRAVLIAGAVCAAGGVLAFATIRNPAPAATGPRPPADPALDCAACPVLAPHIKPR
jgi:hypothetical protein